MGNLNPPSPPPPKSRIGKWQGLLFHFILSKIVDSLQPEGCPAARIDLAQTRNLRGAPLSTSVSVPCTTLFIYPSLSFESPEARFQYYNRGYSDDFIEAMPYMGANEHPESTSWGYQSLT